MRKLFIIFLLSAVPVLAQSPFALTNLGPDVRSSDARADARCWGLADYDTLTPSFHNLASLAGLKKVTISMSGYGEFADSQDDSLQRKSYRVRTPSLRAAVPFMDGNLVVSAGLRGLRGTQYDTQHNNLWYVESDTGTVEIAGIAYFRRDGTQFEVPLGVSFVLPVCADNDMIRVGASLNLVQGTIRERATDSFTDPVDNNNNPIYRPTTEIRTDEIGGLSSTFSVLLTPSEMFTLGASYTTAHDWDITRTYEMTGVAGNVVSEHKWHLPAVWNAGASVKPADRLRFGFEFESQPMSGYTGNPVYEDQMTDGWTFGVGAERLSATKRRGGFSNLPLRFGFRRQKWNYTVNNEEIMENRISVGSGFPFKSKDGHLDFALSYGWAGDMQKHGVEDKYLRMTVSVTGLEKWW